MGTDSVYNGSLEFLGPMRASLKVWAIMAGFLLFGWIPLTEFRWSPLYTGMRPTRDAQARTAQSQLVSFRTALEEYSRDNGDPPTTRQGLAALITKPTVPPVPRHWHRYLTDVDYVPKDPWGNEYRYRSPGPAHELYWIASYGADGKPGGTNYDADIVVRPSSLTYEPK
jgi:general secretion pathway protein G